MTKRLRSTYLRTVQLRLYNLKAISPKLDLGNSLTVSGFEKAVTDFDNKIETYNSLLAKIDGLRSEIRADERDIRNLSERMLLAVGARYGKDSAEYKKAGGTRKSERQRPSPSASTGEEGPPTVQPA